MQLRELPISGHYENDQKISESLQLAAPENDQEREDIARAILAEPEAVAADSARPDYAFLYELGKQLESGLFALRITANDASDRRHAVEIAAGLVINGVSEPRIADGLPMWFISKGLHYRPVEGTPREYHRPAFGRLRLADAECLPQRRLFGAVI